MMEYRSYHRLAFLTIVSVMIYVAILRSKDLSLSVEYVVVNKTDVEASGSQLNGAVQVFDLTGRFKPATMYANISCKRAGEVKITFCVPGRNANKNSKGSSAYEAIPESFAFRKFVDVLIQHPDLLVFDLGAFVGHYTLLAAKLKHLVIAVEAFYENLLCIHKAAAYEKTYEYITLLHNALYDKSNELGRLKPAPSNLAAQKLDDFHYEINRTENASMTSAVDSKYLVKTITMDDLVDFVPRSLNSSRPRAVMKIDIEGHEAVAFQKAQQLFDVVNVCFIFMDWSHQTDPSQYVKLILKMVDFLYSQGFQAYENIASSKELDPLLVRSDWPAWPPKVVWKKACL